mgnify:FL=1|tara:strand:+ start:516 stop:1010 length:495 start_codon:yes stop_codon:yes gene_type:complete
MSANEYELNYLKGGYYNETIAHADSEDAVYHEHLCDSVSNLTDIPGYINNNTFDNSTKDTDENNHEFTHDSENTKCNNTMYSLADSIEGPHLYESTETHEKIPINQHHNVSLNENDEYNNNDEYDNDNNDEELNAPLLQKRELKKSCAVCCCILMISMTLLYLS